jgi:hypothetical protein
MQAKVRAVLTVGFSHADTQAANARRQSGWGRRLIANSKWQIQDGIANS